MAKRKRSSRRRKKPESLATDRNSLRAFAQEIFSRSDPVQAGCDLLGAQSESVKARVWESLANWAFGGGPGGGAVGAAPGVHVIWDIPAPPHESQTPE